MRTERGISKNTTFFLNSFFYSFLFEKVFLRYGIGDRRWEEGKRIAGDIGGREAGEEGK